MKPLHALVPVVLVSALLAGCGSSPSTSPSPSSPGGAGPCTYTPDGNASKPVDPPPATPTTESTVQVTTNLGDFTLTLTPDATPCTTGSFVSLAKQGYFDGTTCHRLTTSGIFVLQCGDPTASGSGGPGYTIPDELDGSETYPAGTLAMANIGQPDTGGSQFFIVYADTELPPSYTVFGTIDAAGLALVQKVAKDGLADNQIAPATAVDLEKVTVGS